VSTFTVPEASGRYRSCGGRFGTHSSNENFTPIYYGRILFLAHFNAGVRAVDVRDPYHPREIAYFIPSVTASTEPRCIKVEGVDRCKVAIQTNNVEVDGRGYVYIVDRANTGLHILQLTGAAREIPTCRLQLLDSRRQGVCLSGKTRYYANIITAASPRPARRSQRVAAGQE
jgi:hypothetical protein